jgi:hypothetical protein
MWFQNSKIPPLSINFFPIESSGKIIPPLPEVSKLGKKKEFF